MTKTLTTETLRALRDSLKSWQDGYDPVDNKEQYEMFVTAETAVGELLANREAQPVAEVVSKFGDPEAFGEREIKVLADLQKIPYDTQLFTAPPAPAVQHVTVIPEAATLTNINQLCPLDNNLSQTDFATGWNDCRQYAITNDRVPPVAQGWHSAAQGWNACRAAMLAAPKGGK